MGWGWTEVETQEKSWIKCCGTSQEGSCLRELHILVCSSASRSLYRKSRGLCSIVIRLAWAPGFTPPPAGTEKYPLVTINPRKLFPSSQISLSIPARRMEETYIYQVFISKATVEFFSLYPFMQFQLVVGYSGNHKGSSKKKQGKKT